MISPLVACGLAAQRRNYFKHARPQTPLVGTDVFVPDDAGRVLLIRRADNGMRALPGGFHDLNETPATCAIRECHEETGLSIQIVRLLGVFSSNRYQEINYPHKGGKYVHILFLGERIGGIAQPTTEAREIGFFTEDQIPPLSDGHDVRIALGFRAMQDQRVPAHFE